MSRCNLKILFCIKIFFVLFNVIVTKESIFENMSIEEKRSFFGTADGSVPEFELVQISKSPRSKRTAQSTLNVTFNYFGTFATTILNIVDDHDLIGETTTGIWLAEYNLNAYHNVFYTPRPDIHQIIGEFDLFQNVNDGSAVTRFWDSEEGETYTGILKRDYIIKSVPSRFADGTINFTGKQDKKFLEILIVFKTVQVPQEYYRHRSQAQISILPDLSLHRSRRNNAQPINLPNVVYPKLLIALEYSLTLHKGYVDFVKQLIAHFNAVDIRYRQLSDPKVRLKIAGIIIPQDELATPYIRKDIAIDGNRMMTVTAHNSIHATRKHFLHEEHRFPFNTYDVVVVITEDMIKYEVNDTLVAGISFARSVCNKNWGVTVVAYDMNYFAVTTMTHELGHVFGADHDGVGTSMACKAKNRHIMAPKIDLTGPASWSTCSQRALRLFLRSKKANCMHNPPNEMLNTVKSMQGSWLSIFGQCENQFNDASDYCLNPVEQYPSSCGNYGCLRNGFCHMTNHELMDGSLSRDGKRCINKTWVSLSERRVIVNLES